MLTDIVILQSKQHTPPSFLDEIFYLRSLDGEREQKPEDCASGEQCERGDNPQFETV